MTVTGGIEDTISGKNPKETIPQIQIGTPIKFAGNALVKTSGYNNELSFYNSGTVIDLADNTVHFSAAGTSSIDVSGAVAGAGTVLLTSNVSFDNSSPDFNGKIIIEKGSLVNVGNQTASGKHGTVDAFGNSSIEIMNGGALSVFAAGTTKFTINNDITLSGNGVTNSDGSVTGTISACLTHGQEGCDSSASVRLTGHVKLVGNAQIGESTPSSSGANNAHVDYTFSDLNKNGYKLNLVTGYNYKVNY